MARRAGGRTVLAHAHATSPLRLLEPTLPSSNAAAACLVTFGGGLVDGDAIDVELVVEPGAVLVVFTQASTKVFRGASRQAFRAEVAGTLVLLPDPVAAFAGARYEQRVEVALIEDGACVLLDGFTSGRAAFGERWAFDRLDLRTRVTRGRAGGPTLAYDALVLDAADGAIDARLDRFEVMQTLLALGAGAGRERLAPIVKSMLAPVVSEELVAAPSALAPAVSTSAGGALVRVAAKTPQRALTEVRGRLRNLPEIGAVDPFEARR